MKAFVYDSKSKPTGMRFADNISAPPSEHLSKGQVLVSVKAASINPIDYKRSTIPVIGWGLQLRPVAQDFSGVVLKAGPGSKFKEGDSVYGNAEGCIAEKLVACDNHIALKPPSLTFNEASSLPTVGLTSLQALRAAGAAPGKKVIVVGASGGCGSIGCMLARYLVGPTGTVAGICGTSNIDFVKQNVLGPQDPVLDYRNKEGLLGPSSPLHTLKPFDILYDTVTSPDASDTLGGVRYDEALRPFLKPPNQGGMVAAINGSMARWSAAIIGWKKPGYTLVMKKSSAADLEELTRAVEAGAVKPIIDHVYPFSEGGLSEAFERVKSRRARGKCCVDVHGGDER